MSTQKMRTRAILFSFTLLAAAPAAAQVQLLSIDENVPLVATLDNPCTPAPEAILFRGAVQLKQDVWLQPGGTVRLVIEEHTAMRGEDTAALLGATPVKYGFSGGSVFDAEFASSGVSVLTYKKVTSTTSSIDQFHAILSLTFDPATLRLEARVSAACDNGE